MDYEKPEVSAPPMFSPDGNGPPLHNIEPLDDFEDPPHPDNRRERRGESLWYDARNPRRSGIRLP